MSEPKRQHSIAAVTQALQIIKQNFFTILIILFVGSGGQGTIFEFIGILPVLLFLLVAGVLEWWRFTYQIVEGDLHIKRGVFVRKNLYLSPERIQVIDINAGLIQRMFGLVSVEVKTAGNTSKDAKIDAVSKSEAEKIKDLLPKRGQASDEEEAESATPRVYKLETKELLIAAATSGNITLTLALVAGALSQFQQFIDEEQIVEFIERAPAFFEANIALSIIILALMISWILSFAGTVIRYYGFTLTVRKDELHVQSGLFTQKQSTVPFDRIQGIRIKEELLREPFGLHALFIESAGYGEHQQNATTLHPLLHKSEISAFLNEVLPEYNVVVEGIKPPVRSLRRYILRPVWLAVFVIIPFLIWVPYGIYSLFLLIPAVIMGYAQYKTAMIGVSDDTMVTKSRKLSRRTAIVKRPRIQAAEKKQNPFQKRLGLYSFQVTIASGGSGRTFRVKELDEDGGYDFLKWLRSKKQTTNLK